MKILGAAAALLLSTTLFFIASLSTTSFVDAITFGEPDDGRTPYVGTLLFVQNGQGYYSCTGTCVCMRAVVVTIESRCAK